MAIICWNSKQKKRGKFGVIKENLFIFIPTFQASHRSLDIETQNNLKKVSYYDYGTT